MSIEKVISIVKGLDYPLEKPENLEEAFENIKKSEGFSVSNIPFTYLSLYKKCPHLSLFILERRKTNISHAISSWYTIICRAQSRRYNDISPYQYWNENKQKVIDLALIQLEKYKDTYIPEELPIEMGGIESDKNSLSLENECSLCLFRLGMPAAFPSILMTGMLKPLKEKDNLELKILDISAGWGDRLIGACALDSIYTSCDPNSKLKDIYVEMIKKYGNPEKQRVYCLPFEDWNIENHDIKYNVLYSSPPFFDLEIYSNESTQSSERYKTIDSWISNFLKPCLNKCDELLEKNAKIYLHLSDIIIQKHNNYEERKIIFVEDIIEYCKNILKWKFIGVYGHILRDKEDKESETKESREQKNKLLLKPTPFIKGFKDGLRINKYNQALAQSIWHFTKK
jgi:hypothetical protein